MAVSRIAVTFLLFGVVCLGIVPRTRRPYRTVMYLGSRNESRTRWPYGTVMCQTWCESLSRDCVRWHFDPFTISCTVTVKFPQERIDRYIRLENTSLEVKVHEGETTWPNALKMCVREGGTLFAPYSAELQDAYKQIVFPLFQRKRRWVGLWDKYNDDTWYWTTGSKVKRGWHSRQPNNKVGHIEENCASIDAYRMQWVDLPCQKNVTYVCERLY